VIDYELKNPPSTASKPGEGEGGAATAPNASAVAPSGGQAPKRPEKAAVKIEIDDSAGHVIRQYPPKSAEDEEGASEFPGFRGRQNNVPAEKGLNRFTWDLSYEPATRVPGTAHWGGGGGGPQVLPGTYEVKLTAEGHTYTAPLEVKLDPRLKVTRADLEKRLDLALKIRDGVSADHDAVNQIRSVRAQLTALQKRLGGDERAKPLSDSAKVLDKKMTAIEEKLMQTKSKASEDPLNYPVKLDDRMGALGGAVESADAAPTEQDYTVFNLVNGELQQVLAEWQAVRSQDLAQFNAQAAKAGVGVIGVKEDRGEADEAEASK
jgi:hypothetical protein